MLQEMFTYISTHIAEIGQQVGTHLAVSLLSLLAASLIGLPCGYLASKSVKWESAVSVPFEILRVVPSLALLVLLIPLIGTGALPAVIALTILAIPPILLNTIAGFRSVPDFLVESASGIGMTEKEIIRKVQIPSAMPMILAGLRTALVEVVASATLTAKIGAGGLGEIIFTGLGLSRTDLLLLGGVLVAILSLVCGLVFDRISRRILKYKYV